MEFMYLKKNTTKIHILLYISLFSFICLLFYGCGGYSNQSIFPEDVKTIYLKMFDNQDFRRGIEYDLTDALAKRIEADTPYKIVSNQDYADSVISGQIVSIGEFALTTERDTGHVLEKEVEVRAVVNWKNLKTGELLIDSRTIGSSASYSEYQQQDFKYGSTLAANNLAVRIVELMEKDW